MLKSWETCRFTSEMRTFYLENINGRAKPGERGINESGM
jgi:hypothetical protein